MLNVVMLSVIAPMLIVIAPMLSVGAPMLKNDYNIDSLSIFSYSTLLIKNSL